MATQEGLERAVGKSRGIDLKKPGPLPANVLDYNNFNTGWSY